MTILPIDTILPEIRNTLAATANLVLAAPPGSGKTTRIPLALLNEPWLSGRRIVMLEPRRLAARSAARYMAGLLGEAIGETVGYRVRLDTKVGPKTRIEVITEGVLTRMLQSDPALDGVGLVIFDEFHERSIHADLGLSLVLEAQAILREDLKIVVMSATLEIEPVAVLLNKAPAIRGEGQVFPVETRYLQRRVEGRVEPVLVETVLDALKANQGDILVFLPGAGEIHRVAARLTELGFEPKHGVSIAPLYGVMSQADQDLALAPSPPGQRKVVLATSIAETSLTVEGVRVVVDSGLMRVPRFSPRTGMTRLETVTVSRAAADQRRGRAGRLGPGVCYRLWTEIDDLRLEPRSTPEILTADLAPLALELAAWGVNDPTDLRWLDLPPAMAFIQARELLNQLGALDQGGAITPHGRQMAAAGLHPRLAHLVVAAMLLGLGKLACELAALLSERDVLRSNGAAPDADLRLRIEALRRTGSKAGRQESATGHGFAVDIAACRRLNIEINNWQRQFAITPSENDTIDACGLLLALAYPDRIAQQRGGGRFLLQNGRGAVLPESQLLAHTPYLVAAELDDQGPESRIFLAAPVDLANIYQQLKDQITHETVIAWDSAAQAVRARKTERLGAIVLKDTPLAASSPEATLAALLHGIATEGLAILPWTKTARQLRQRLLFMHELESEWPDVSDETLIATLSDWLGPYLCGLASRADLERLNLTNILESLLTWDERRKLDEYAPTHIDAPSGQRIPVDYDNPAAPVLAVRLQEMFGLADTPRIARGKVPLTLHLLSPAHRPVQVTQDLANFWHTTYFEVKKDLLGRYPKHYWPDDPLSAPATHRAKPRQ